MRTLLIFISILTINSLAAQDSNTTSNKFEKCKLPQENKIWREKAESETDTIKLINSIKEKITSDTIYKKYIPEVKPINQSFSTIEYIDESGNFCGRKILFIIEYKKYKNLIINDLKNSEQIDIINEISPDNAEIFLISADKGGTALYGTSGSEGLVFMKIKRKSLKKKVKNLYKKLNH